MVQVKENEMQRGLSQALYKYLPDSWIDFILRRKNCIYKELRIGIVESYKI